MNVGGALLVVSMASAVTIFIYMLYISYVVGARNEFTTSTFFKSCNYVIMPSLSLAHNALHSSSIKYPLNRLMLTQKAALSYKCKNHSNGM